MDVHYSLTSCASPPVQSETLKEVKHHLQVAVKREEELAHLQGNQEQMQQLLAEREHLRMENRKVCIYI